MVGEKIAEVRQVSGLVHIRDIAQVLVEVDQEDGRN